MGQRFMNVDARATAGRRGLGGMSALAGYCTLAEACRSEGYSNPRLRAAAKTRRSASPGFNALDTILVDKVYRGSAALNRGRRSDDI